MLTLDDVVERLAIAMASKVQVTLAVPKAMTPKKHAERLGCRERPLFDAFRRDEIVGSIVGKRVLLDTASVDAWIASRRVVRVPMPVADDTASKIAASIAAARRAR